MTCKARQENNGVCPHHNLQCGWPQCNEPAQPYPENFIDALKYDVARRDSEQQCRTDGRCQYAIDSGAEGMGHCPKGKCVMPAQRKPLTDEAQVLRSLLGAALGALRYHTEQTRPIQRTNETIAAIEHELAAHDIKEQP